MAQNKPFTSLASLSTRGFTIVELLIVVVVIAILAAVTIVAYNGISVRATESTMKSDLQTAAKVLENDKTTTGVYPIDAISAQNGEGLKSSGSNELTYIQTASGYCIEIKNTKTSSIFRLRSSEGVIGTGTCVAQVTTLAGSDTSGFADGTGASAEFNLPTGVAVDASGNVYVADHSNNRIRKITSNGVVTTFAGSGVAGYLDATGTAAQFSGPDDLSFDSSGNLFVLDTDNNRIRKITPSGVVTTFAGSGAIGSANGNGVAAQFNYPRGIAVDSSGNVYVADTGNQLIRKITPGGVVSTLAGATTTGNADGNAVDARFYNPSGLAINGSGNLYVADSFNNRIRVVTPDGTVTTLAGSTAGYVDNNTGTAARFDGPYGLTIDSSGTIYVADSNNYRIRMVTSSGAVTTLAGSGYWTSLDGPATTAGFKSPHSLTVDSSGTIYVADRFNNRIRVIK